MITAGVVSLLEAAVVLEEREAVEPLAAALRPAAHFLANGSRGTAMVVSNARLLAAAEALLGHTEQSKADYQLAIETCGKIGFRPDMALARLGLAELLLEHYPDERANALEHLDFAIAEFREMKMQPALERALKHKGLLHA